MIPFALATLDTDRGPQAALAVNGDYHLLGNGNGPVSVRALFDDWDRASRVLTRAADDIAEGRSDLVPVPAVQARLLTPVRYPDKLLAVGANYSGHLAEMGLPVEKWEPMPFFLRPPSTTLVGPGPTVEIPRSTRQFDWECELAVVLGRPLRHAGRAEAAAAIAGYAIGLDLTCRDLITVDNELGTDLARGKAQDTMAPCGPVVVPARFIPDTSDLPIRLTVNGEPMMDASTAEMIFPIEEQLSRISEHVTLMPGDVLFTGSPSGSAGEHGGRWLRPGDRISATIGDIPALTVTMRAG